MMKKLRRAIRIRRSWSPAKNIIDKRRVELFLAIWSIIMLAAWKIPLVFSLCHAVVNIFAGGRSVSKTWLFLAYVPLLLVVSLLVRERIQLKLRRCRSVLIAFFAGGLTLNLVSYIMFIRRFGLSARDWVLVFSAGEMSSVGLLHNHVLKGSVGIVLSWFGFEQIENMDAGQAYLALLPHWLFWLGTAMTAAALLLVALDYLFAWTDDRRQYDLAGTTLYAILTFCLVKNMIDGGLFNPEAVVGLAFFLAISYPRRSTKILAAIAILSYVVLLVLFQLIGFFAPSNQTWNGLMSVLIGLVAYALLLAPLYHRSILGRWNRTGILLAVLAVSFLITAIASDLKTVRYGFTRIDDYDWAIVGLYDTVTAPQYEEYGRVGDLMFYKLTPDQPTTAAEVMSQHQLLDNFYPLAFPYRDCFPHGLNQIYEFTLITSQQLDITGWENQLVSIVQAEHLGNESGRNRYLVKLAIRPCIPRSINVVQEVLKELGAEPAIVLNIQRGFVNH
ncbi:MAG: hypothetical protein V1738_00245 [Patescibacteria group bacterium]